MGVGISMAGLASAVAREGGAGTIATAGIGFGERDLASNFLEANRRSLRRTIREARSRGDGVLGVNIMAALTNFDDLARTAIEEGIDFIASGAGLPLNLPALRPTGTRTALIPIVSSARAAAILTRRWRERFDCLPDALVVEGPLAGGHLGFRPEDLANPALSLDRLLADVRAHLEPLEQRYGQRVPVIAAGGIYTGGDIRRFLELGADGVQMATRFVTTEECDASPAFKQAYLDAREEDGVIIRSPVGLPGRALRNAFTEAVGRGQRVPFRCAYHCIRTCDVENSPYCIARVLLNAREGNFRRGFAFAGANAWRATEIVPVHALFETLAREYAESAESAPA